MHIHRIASQNDKDYIIKLGERKSRCRRKIMEYPLNNTAFIV
jgi:hypothetical protein